MPFLTLNGVTVRVAVDSVTLDYIDVGGTMERSSSGQLVGGPTVAKREWRMTTTPLPASEVDAWVGLIEGSGHAWPFDTDTYSSRGRGPAFGSASVVTGMKWGAGCLPVNTPSSIGWEVGLGSDWTLLWWSKASAGAWTHWVTRSDETAWHNGAPFTYASLLGEVYVDGGDVVLYGADGDNWLIDDVVALPYAVPDAWVAGLYAQHSAGAWSALPRVTAAGTFAPSAVTVRGKVSGSKVIRCSLNGALTTGYALDFALREV